MANAATAVTQDEWDYAPAPAKAPQQKSDDEWDYGQQNVDISRGRDVGVVPGGNVVIPRKAQPDFQRHGREALASAMPSIIGGTAGFLGGPLAPETGAAGVALGHMMEPMITGEKPDYGAAAKDAALTEVGGRALTLLPEIPGMLKGAKDTIGELSREPGKIDPYTGKPTPGNLRPWAKALPFQRGVSEAVLPANPNPRLIPSYRLPKPPAVAAADPPLPGIPGATSTGSTIGNEALPPAAARGGMTSTGPTPITMTGPAVAPGKTAKLPGQVLRVPEPSGGDPRWMASVPRGKLPGLAAQGREGAAEQLQNIGKTVLIEPRGGDIANVRERTTFGSEGNVAETRQVPPEERVQTAGAVPRNAFGEPIPTPGRSAPAAPAAPLKISKDSVGITWAEDANGVRVSIPKSVPPENVEQYARQQIDQQAKAQAQLKGEIGKSAATPTEPPKLTDEQVRDARAQVADLRKRALAYRDKMSASRGWRTANEHMRMQQQLEEKASQIERDLGQGKPAAPKAEPAKVDLSATYNNASPEIKKQVDQLADEYKNIESYEKAHFEHDYNLNSSLTKGLPIKEKLARYLSARGAKP